MLRAAETRAIRRDEADQSVRSPPARRHPTPAASGGTIAACWRRGDRGNTRPARSSSGCVPRNDQHPGHGPSPPGPARPSLRPGPLSHSRSQVRTIEELVQDSRGSVSIASMGTRTRPSRAEQIARVQPIPTLTLAQGPPLRSTGGPCSTCAGKGSGSRTNSGSVNLPWVAGATTRRVPRNRPLTVHARPDAAAMAAISCWQGIPDVRLFTGVAAWRSAAALGRPRSNPWRSRHKMSSRLETSPPYKATARLRGPIRAWPERPPGPYEPSTAGEGELRLAEYPRSEDAHLRAGPKGRWAAGPKGRTCRPKRRRDRKGLFALAGAPVYHGLDPAPQC